MFKFIIKNFQSIEYQELELNSFTLLVGSSNLGKSAVVRALKALLYCEFEKSFIRKNTDASELTLQFLNTNPLNIFQIKYTRSYTKHINSYTITFNNGEVQEFEKVGTEVPDIIKQLGFKKIEIEKNSDSLNPNFQSQLEGLFLFNTSNTQISSYFNKIFNIDKYENALRECNKDILNFTKEYNATKTEHSKAVLDLDDINTDKALKELRLKQAEQLKLKYFKLKETIATLKEYKDINIELSNNYSLKIHLQTNLQLLMNVISRVKLLYDFKEYRAKDLLVKYHQKELIYNNKFNNIYVIYSYFLSQQLVDNNKVQQKDIQIKLKTIQYLTTKHTNILYIKHYLNDSLKLKTYDEYLINCKNYLTRFSLCFNYLNTIIALKSYLITYNYVLSLHTNISNVQQNIYTTSNILDKIKNLVQIFKYKIISTEIKSAQLSLDKYNNYSFDILHEKLIFHKLACEKCGKVSI